MYKLEPFLDAPGMHYPCLGDKVVASWLTKEFGELLLSRLQPPLRVRGVPAGQRFRDDRGTLFLMIAQDATGHGHLLKALKLEDYSMYWLIANSFATPVDNVLPQTS